MTVTRTSTQWWLDLPRQPGITDAVRGLVGGGPDRPDRLEWYLWCCVLRRLVRAVRRAEGRWHSRTDLLLEHAGALAPR